MTRCTTPPTKHISTSLASSSSAATQSPMRPSWRQRRASTRRGRLPSSLLNAALTGALCIQTVCIYRFTVGRTPPRSSNSCSDAASLGSCPARITSFLSRRASPCVPF
eukprot:Amastigsp_a510249_39.p5 type:complete len:108 gc:universal Amastigsp_a510249_39:1073-1396(+)